MDSSKRNKRVKRFSEAENIFSKAENKDKE